jgi:hypothetical protein
MSAGLAVVCAVVLLAGCGAKTDSPATKTVRTTAAETRHVTLHVQDMTKRLSLG